MQTPATPAINWATFSPIVEALTEQLSVANIVVILAGILAVTVVFAFFWWAGRKVIRKVMSAFKSGRVGI